VGEIDLVYGVAQLFRVRHTPYRNMVA
jgi:hypothetical protein